MSILVITGIEFLIHPSFSMGRVFIENHDEARSVSRFGNDTPEWRARCAKMFCIFQITQSGTLFVYQGQEIGMKNIPKSWTIDEYKDVATINFWNQYVRSHVGETFVLTIIFLVSGHFRNE